MSWDLKEPECLSQARLTNASPEFVYDQLRYYSENIDRFSGKEELEKALLARNDRLINLALAQHSTQKDIIFDLYCRASNVEAPDGAYNLGLRVACLSNRHFDYFNWPAFDLHALMANGLNDETYALLTNPTAPESLLEALFNKRDCFAQVNDSSWLHFIQAVAKNERLNIDDSNESDPDMGHYSIHRAIFHFLEIAPVTPHGVNAASVLLNALEPEHCARPDDILHVLTRWRQANYKGDETEGWSTHLTLKEELVCLIGALYGHRNPSQKNTPPLFGATDDADIALRCAYYGCGKMTEKEVAAGLKRDNDVFLFAALKNSQLYLNKKTRELLEDSVGGNFRYEYKRRCEQLHKKYSWFDPRPTTETGRDVMEDLNPTPSREITLLENINRQAAVLIDRITTYERRAYFAVIIIVAAMYFLRK